jgi:tryptophan synthase alpha chain
MSGQRRIREAFVQIHPRAALMPYFTIGYPNLPSCMEIVEAIAQAGADLIELGIPFSDPLADGPTIQRSTQIALENGLSVEGCLEFTEQLRKRGVQQPVLLMGYINPILAYGVKQFVEGVVRAGADGLIVPDLPLEESLALLSACQDNGCALIFMLAPTSSEERIDLVAQRAQGFIYLVSVTGTTGARSGVSQKLGGFIETVRTKTDLPLAIGFGISTAQQAQLIGRMADGVIVGSALIDAVSKVEFEVAPQAAATIVQAMRLSLESDTR